MFDLEKLCSIDAVSGNEYKLSEYIMKIAEDYVDDVSCDSYGNVLAQINNNSDYTVMLEAHIDQIGLVVKSIDSDGFIKFISSGGVDSSILPTAEVTVHGNKDLFGVIGAKPPHLQNKDDTKEKNIEDLYIDCGLGYDEIIKFVKPGDTISLISSYDILANDYVSTKSLDNRIGVYIALKCLERLNNVKLPYNLSVLFSVQEETGGRGALLTAERIMADAAVVIDVTFGISPYTDEEFGFPTGEGISVAVGPNVDRRLADNFMKNCTKNNVPFRKEVCCGSTGTDAWPIQISGEGVRCVVVSVPIKYMHTSVETVNMKDIDMAVNAISTAMEGGCFYA